MNTGGEVARRMERSRFEESRGSAAIASRATIFRQLRRLVTASCHLASRARGTGVTQHASRLSVRLDVENGGDEDRHACYLTALMEQ